MPLSDDCSAYTNKVFIDPQNPNDAGNKYWYATISDAPVEGNSWSGTPHGSSSCDDHWYTIKGVPGAWHFASSEAFLFGSGSWEQVGNDLNANKKPYGWSTDAVVAFRNRTFWTGGNSLSEKPGYTPSNEDNNILEQVDSSGTTSYKVQYCGTGDAHFQDGATANTRILLECGGAQTQTQTWSLNLTHDAHPTKSLCLCVPLTCAPA